MIKMKKRLTQLDETIKQRRILKDNLQATKLANLGLFEQASKVQAPTIQEIAKIPPVITKTAEDTKKGLELVKKAVETLPPANEVIKPLDFQSSERSYNLVRTDARVKTIVGDL